jgi:hypothetical protein
MGTGRNMGNRVSGPITNNHRRKMGDVWKAVYQRTPTAIVEKQLEIAQERVDALSPERVEYQEFKIKVRALEELLAERNHSGSQK